MPTGGWDYVVLQEQSTAPAMPTGQVAREVYPAARTLDSLVHAASPDARVIFYMTWGHKNGNRLPDVRNTRPRTATRTMQERLITSYLEMAYDNGAWCAPVGMAWRRGAQPSVPTASSTAPDCYHPAAAGQLPGCQRHFHDDPPASPYQTGLYRWSFRPSRPNISSVRPSEPCSTTSCC